MPPKNPAPIKIKKSRRGVFTEKAKKRGMTPAQFAAAVAKNPGRYDATTRKQATFARGIAKAARAKGRSRGRG